MKTIRYFLYFYRLFYNLLFSTTTLKLDQVLCVVSFHLLFRYNDELFCLLCEET